MGWDPEKKFYVPDEVYEAFSMVAEGEQAHAEWNDRFAGWRSAHAELADEWDLAWKGSPQVGD